MFITLSLNYVIANINAYNFQPYLLLFIFGIIINVILIYIINKEKNKDFSHYLIIYINFASIIYALAEIFRNFFTNQVTSYFFLNFGNIGYISIPVLLFLFSLIYTKRFGLLRNKLLLTYSIIGAMLLYLAGNATDLINPQSFFTFNPYGNQEPVLANNVTNYFLIPFLCTFIFGSVIFFAIYIFTLKEKNLKRQAIILMVGCFISIAIGLFFMLGLRQLWNPTYGINIFPLMFTGFALTFFIDRIRYKFLVVNPATVAANIVNTMEEMLMVFNINDFKIEYVNDAVIRILKYDKLALENKPLNLIFGTDLQILEKNVFSQLKMGKPVENIEVEFLSMQGEKIPVSLSTKAYSGAGEFSQSIIVVARDIRKLKSLSLAVFEQQKLNAVLESISDGVIALDLEGRVVMLNKAAENIIGIQKEALIGNLFDETVLLTNSKNIKINAQNLLQETSRKDIGEIIYQDEVTLKYNNKTSFIRLTSTAIPDAYKIGLGSIITIFDHNEEKRLEGMKFDFVFRSVHDLRFPLSVLKENIKNLFNKSSEYNKDELQTIEVIDEVTDRIIRTVENLSTVTKIEQGKLILEKEEADMVDLISNAIWKVGNQIKSKNIDIDFEKPKEDLPLILVDKLKITEVISNILSNAAFFSKDKGKIIIKLEKLNSHIKVSIQDFGEGIPSEALPHLFTKFFRISKKLQQGSQGVGLGLYISKAIIDAHQGTIQAASEGLSQGSTFSFTIPIS